MRTQLLALLAASTLAMSAGAAHAQAWMTINERQVRLDERIDRGVRNGALTRDEAYRLRADFRALADLETRYRLGGLSGAERADLDRRFDELSARIRDEVRDPDRWDDRDDDRPDSRPDYGPPAGADFDTEIANLQRRIEVGRRSGRLSPGEATRLRTDLDLLIRDEARYRSEIDRRLDALIARIPADRRPGY
ncbi:MAG TPA: hypothetical protein VIO94_17170 [Phenylobacterium sp.]